jgi:hypothetical protein
VRDAFRLTSERPKALGLFLCCWGLCALKTNWLFPGFQTRWWALLDNNNTFTWLGPKWVAGFAAYRSQSAGASAAANGTVVSPGTLSSCSDDLSWFCQPWESRCRIANHLNIDGMIS